MTSPSANTSDQLGEARRPSFKSLKERGVTVSPSFHVFRLRWCPWDPPSAIRVLDDATDANSAQQPYETPQQQEGGEPSPPQLHPISALPITNPPVSSIDVTIRDLDDWLGYWLDEHGGHGDYPGAEDDPNGARPVWSDGPSSDPENDPDEGTWHEHQPQRRRLRCCGFSRPPRPPSLTVRAAEGTSSPGYVTFGDYIAALHPWLLSLRDDIVLARAEAVPEDKPFGPEPNPDEEVYFDAQAVDSFGIVGDSERSMWDMQSFWEDNAQIAARQVAEVAQRQGGL